MRRGCVKQIILLVQVSCFWACGQVAQPVAKQAKVNHITRQTVTISSSKEVSDSGLEFVPTPAKSYRMEITDPPFSWYEQAELIADREYLGASFKRAGYSPPKRTFLVAGEVIKGAGQPAYRYYSLDDTAFTHSEGNFWPASTVKLLAAIGALYTLDKYGLTGAARLDFEDDRGHFKGTVSTLYNSALTMSNNKAYDWLVKIAGFNEFNVELFCADNGFPNVKLQRSYDPSATTDFRTSPEIHYKERDLEGVIPKRSSEVTFDECPEGSNCLTLFELLDALRRVMLHKELPKQDQFKLHRTDLIGLKRALGKSKCRVAKGAEEGLGHPIECFNKSGWYPHSDQNDHAFIVDTITNRRYLISQSIPHHDKDATALEMTKLAAKTLRAVARAKRQGPVLQRNGGLKIEVFINDRGQNNETINITTTVKGSADRLELWRNYNLVTQTQKKASTDSVSLSSQLIAPFERSLFILQAFKGKRLVGYRSFVVSMKTT